jgi:hypothetical protein
MKYPLKSFQLAQEIAHYLNQDKNYSCFDESGSGEYKDDLKLQNAVSELMHTGQ